MPTTVPVVSLTTPPVLTALRVSHVARGSTAKKGRRPQPTTATAGTTTRARGRQPGAAASTATNGSTANCLHKKATPKRTPVATHRRRNVSARPSADEPDAHQVLGMERLDDAVAGGGRGGEHHHEQHLGEPAAGSRHPQEPDRAQRHDHPGQDPEHGLGPVPAVAGQLRRLAPRQQQARDGRHAPVAPFGRADQRPEDEDERRGEQRVPRGLGEHRGRGGGAEVTVGEGGGRLGHPVGVSHRGPAPHRHDPHEGAQRGEVHHHHGRRRNATRSEARARSGRADGRAVPLVSTRRVPATTTARLS